MFKKGERPPRGPKKVRSDEGIPQKVLDHVKDPTIPDRYRQMYLDAWRYPKSRSKAARAKCVECTGFEDCAPRIRACSVLVCPSHMLRAYQNKKA